MAIGEALTQLEAVVRDRIAAGDADASYVASLAAKGTGKIAQKIGEEAIETVMAAKDKRPDRIVAETADLWFHTLVMLAHYGLGPREVIAELQRREGLSGLDEKAARKLNQAPE